MAKCIPTITDCVLAELEKLGPKYRLALKWVDNNSLFFEMQNIEGRRGADLRIIGLQRTRGLRDYIVTASARSSKSRPAIPDAFITDNGTYADDCLVQRVTVHKCYIVATVRQFHPI